MGKMFDCRECGKEIDHCFELESGEWLEEINGTGGLFFGYCMNCDLAHVWGIGDSFISRADEFGEVLQKAKLTDIHDVVKFLEHLGYYLDWPEMH